MMGIMNREVIASKKGFQLNKFDSFTMLDRTKHSLDDVQVLVFSQRLSSIFLFSFSFAEHRHMFSVPLRPHRRLSLQIHESLELHERRPHRTASRTRLADTVGGGKTEVVAEWIRVSQFETSIEFISLVSSNESRHFVSRHETWHVNRLCLQQSTGNRSIDVNDSAARLSAGRCHEHEHRGNDEVIVRQIPVPVPREQGMHCGEFGVITRDDWW